MEIKKIEPNMVVDNLDAKFKELEKQKKFNEDINPIDWNSALPVTEKFPYIPKGWLKFKYALLNTFIIKPYSWYQAKRVYRTKVVGKENLKGIKSAVITSNHIAIFDCLVNLHILKRKTKIVGAEFNNKKGFFGELMRAGGMLPLSKNLKVIRQLNNAIENALLHNNYVLMYPEQSMWLMYEKPRPFKTGAFHYAVNYDVPIIPMFTTIKSTGIINKKTGEERKEFTVHIGKPLYQNKKHSRQENITNLKEAAFKHCSDVYEQVYGKKVEYEQDESL